MDPWRVIISKDNNGVWNMEVSTTDASPNGSGRSHHDEMLFRESGNGVRLGIERDWKSRRAGGAAVLPHYRLHPGHAPLLVNAGEDVTFVCVPPQNFIIFVNPDPNLSSPNGAAKDPFGWGGPQIADRTGKTARVGGAGAVTLQRFFKCTALVVDDGETITVDPDLICGF